MSPERLIADAPYLLDERGPLGESLLHYYSIEGDLGKVRHLSRLGASVNVLNEFGKTPLIDAATIGNAEMVRLLIEVGADVDAETSDGDTAALLAGQNRQCDVLSELIKAGADVRKSDIFRMSVADYARMLLNLDV